MNNKDNNKTKDILLEVKRILGYEDDETKDNRVSDYKELREESDR